MRGLFIHILNNAWTASMLIVTVIVVRLLIKKAPKWFSCALWGLVAIKLICPVNIESAFSLIPSSKPIPQDIEYTMTPHIETGLPAVNSVINPMMETSLAPAPNNSVNPMQIVMGVSVCIWGLGMALMCFYAFVSYFILRRKVRAARPIGKAIYICDEVLSPFILGFIRPKIYLPSGLDAEVRACVLAHEKAHIQRGDHLWKPLGFFILSVYWFQPLCWVAYILLCRDIELACDEKVTLDKDSEWKAAYCEALLHCCMARRIISACPVAFGETSVKGRIKSIVTYKKPAAWIMIAAIAVIIAVAVCFMTDPKSKQNAASETDKTELSNSEHYDDFSDLPLYVEYSLRGALSSKEPFQPVKYGPYHFDFFLNFQGRYFESTLYEEPLHGESAPEAWYQLGGVGVCADPSCGDFETFYDGKLREYNYSDNHMICYKIGQIAKDGYSGCLYRYRVDLFAAPELAEMNIESKDATLDHWVIFFTKGEGEPLYMAYFNSNYFTLEDSLKNSGLASDDPFEAEQLLYEEGDFEDIMGYAGHYKYIMAGGHSATGYYTAEDGTHLACVWGRTPDFVCVKDIDGDGVTELISPIQWLADGAEDVVIYRRHNDAVQRAFATGLLDEAYLDNGTPTRPYPEYVPGSDTVEIFYTPAEGGQLVSKTYLLDVSKLEWEDDWDIYGAEWTE